tara:strand:+ start:26 stop:472 length:447 start_codon:yes stop_codon:yes gene_type:complete
MALSKITPESINLASDFAGMGFGGTGAANQLDDYEEGTWTGTTTVSGGGTSNVVNEEYIKIGKIVHITFTVNFSGASGTLDVSGLPFASNPASVGIGREDQSNGYAVYGRIISGNSSMSIFYAGASGNATPFLVSAGNMRMSITYRTS